MAALPLAAAVQQAQPQPVDTSDQPDMRRITEHDPDVARLKTRTVRRLTRSIRQFVRDLKSGMQPGEAQSAFIHRHTALMRSAYLAAHKAGQRDYYGAVSRVPGRWATLEPDNATIGRRMAFYAPSVAKMAYEAVQAFNQLSAAPASSDLALSNAQGQPQQSQTFAEKPTGKASNGDPLAYWQEGTAARIVLQADLTWSGVQDGYMEAGWADSANPFSALWWDLEPIAAHCSSCPMFAAGSPYDPPWVDGGNVLNATPGDGNTECGAACKCSLRYGAGAAVGQQPMDMRLWLPTGIPPGTAGVPEDDAPMAPTPPPPARGGRGGATGSPAIPGGAFNAGQKRALDLYRLAELSWNAVRGELPELPNFFTLTNPNFEWPRLSWEDLTAAQKHALETAFEAYAMWMANVPSEWLDYLDDF